ncbi:hypothetical protein BDV25DRAFT_139897 [Aspergillus avenaceus]|uniref:Ribonucleases P/MRP subunit Pop8-like domain-containing protein n=1 Tax=Aspergillus avenaceus TaxID=36643 RepID=A0A5N6TWG6_ASPAV|nr:hypothetical protein BDV25DRAFT_139897 [Aspergillus avenaceus]
MSSTTTTTQPKRKADDNNQKPQRFTSRNPPWTYFKLQLVQDHPTNQPLDALTARTYLTSALSQFRGLFGTAISIDILKIGPDPGSQNETGSVSQEKIVWVRVPREDAPDVVAALSSWIGGGAMSVAWRICARGNYLGSLVQGSGGGLFVS